MRKEDFNKARFQFALQLLSKNNLEDAKIIEIGSGMVEFARTCRQKGYRVFTSDLDFESVMYSKKCGFASICADFSRNLPFRNNVFDGVVMLEVIEHIDNAELLLSESFRILKPKGFLLLSTPNFAHYYNRLRIAFGRPPLREGYHFRFFTRDSIQNAIKNSGFYIEGFCSSTYLPFYNRFRKLLGLKENFFIAPNFFSSLVSNTFFIFARK